MVRGKLRYSGEKTSLIAREAVANAKKGGGKIKKQASTELGGQG